MTPNEILERYSHRMVGDDEQRIFALADLTGRRASRILSDLEQAGVDVRPNKRRGRNGLSLGQRTVLFDLLASGKKPTVCARALGLRCGTVHNFAQAHGLM